MPNSITDEEELATYRKIAERYEREKDYGRKAISINQRIIDEDDRDTAAYIRLAKCYMLKESWVFALEQYLKVLSYEKNTIAKKGVKEIDSKLKTCDLAVEIAKDSSRRRLIEISIEARRQGFNELAKAILSRIIAKRPDETYALNTLGGVYRHDGELDKAKNVYEKSYKINSNITSQIGLAAVERDSGNYPAALKRYDGVLCKEPSNAYALNGLGGVHADMGHMADAEKCFSAAYKIEEGRKDATDGLIRLSNMYRERNDSQSAERIKLLVEHLRMQFM